MLISGYSELSLETPGCHPGTTTFLATFKVDADISHLLPYINAVGENSVYHEHSKSVQFVLDNVRCAVFPDRVHAAKFENRQQAQSFVKKFIDFINDLDQKKATVEPDSTPFKQISVLEIFKLLPKKAKCKACGYLTCMAFAAAVSKGESTIASCPEIDARDDETSEKIKQLFHGFDS